MPSLTRTLTALGPVVRLGISVSAPRRQALEAANLPVPDPVMINVILDTGATDTCVDRSHLAKMGITPSGVADVHTVTTGGVTQQYNQYDVDLVIVLDSGKYFHIETLPVIESEMAAQGIDGLLGRDVLSHGLFFLNGPTSTFTLSF